MRAFIVLAIAAALAAYLIMADPFGTPEPERCPGGICPTPDHAMPAEQPVEAKPVAYTGPVLHAASTLPAPEKPVAKVKPEPYKIDPVTTARGADGWRLRLFYPVGSARGEKLRKQICEMKAIATKYGFDASTTDEKMFSYWKKVISRDEVTLVLVHPDNRIVYRASQSIPTDPIVLREALREAARKSWEPLKAVPAQSDSDWNNSFPESGRFRRW